MVRLARDIWSLVRGQPWIDPGRLLSAVDEACCRPTLNPRTRLLVRDSLDALVRRRGVAAVFDGLSPDARPVAERIRRTETGPVKFPHLEVRMADRTDPDVILELFRDLGRRLRQPARLVVGGSSALILVGLLERATDDIDVVDQLPDAVRTQYELLDTLAQRYGIHLAHFQSHYLPAGYAGRVRSLGRFGQLDVFLVDPLDIFVGKLFSRRDKDLDDLRVMKAGFEKAAVADRLRVAGQTLLAEPRDRANAQANWYVLFGEDALPA